MDRHVSRVMAGMMIWMSCVPHPLWATPQDPPLTVVVVEGQGAINNVRQRAMRDMVVQVLDSKQQPVAGASVAFGLPSQGASGTFLNNEKTLVVTTGTEGKAAAKSLKPNSVAGKFEIRVTASYQGQTATATITQFNMAVQNPKPAGNGKWIAILAIAGAAGVGGAVAATRGSKSSTPGQPSTPAVIGITAGTGTVGPPQ